ncbi:MAG: radical SAM protein [Ignavibacteriaceae bacterium]|nr:radical SAM protein [Ignavibacteriaceae bacterium]
MKKKIYFIQPSYRDADGILLKGKRLYIVSLALPALSAAVPEDWEKDCCYEYFSDVNFDTDASVIGISSMGYEIFRGAEIADIFRAKGKTVIFGGHQPRLSPGFAAEHCDSVICGNPGKKEIRRILDDILAGNLKPQYDCVPDLNYELDYSVIDPKRIFLMPVVTGVGCKNNCGYCCLASIFKGKYYLRRQEHLLNELEYLSKRTHRIAFVDTNIYNNRVYLISLCKKMTERKFSFIWGAQCTIDIGDDPEALSLLRKAGCRVLFIGLESVEQQNLDYVHKNVLVEKFPEQIKKINDAGIKIAAFFIYGMDNDTINTAEEMADFINRYDISLPMINVLVPTPGSEVYQQLISENRLSMQSEVDFLKNNVTYNSSFNICLYKPLHMSPQEVEDGFIDLLRRLSDYKLLFRRSKSDSIFLSLFLFYMNYLFRREYLILRKRRARKDRSESGPIRSDVAGQ